MNESSRNLRRAGDNITAATVQPRACSSAEHSASALLPVWPEIWYAGGADGE